MKSSPLGGIRRHRNVSLTGRQRWAWCLGPPDCCLSDGVNVKRGPVCGLENWRDCLQPPLCSNPGGATPIVPVFRLYPGAWPHCTKVQWARFYWTRIQWAPSSLCQDEAAVEMEPCAGSENWDDTRHQHVAEFNQELVIIVLLFTHLSSFQIPNETRCILSLEFLVAPHTHTSQQRTHD